MSSPYNEPAFPGGAGYPGMTLRDYFAARFAQAELSSAGADDEAAEALCMEADASGQTIEERIAFNAYGLADAMLVERAKATGVAS